MIVYYILLLLCSLGGLISYFLERRFPASKNAIENIFLVFAWLAMTLVEGLRAYDIGTDTLAYTATFASNLSHSFEIGFSLLIDFLHLFSYHPTIYLLGCAALANGLVLHAIKKFSVNPYLSVYFYITLYYYFGSFNGVRQYIAIGFVLNAFISAIQNKKLLFFVNIALAMCFHNSAIVGLSFIYYFIHTNSTEKSISTSYLKEFASMTLFLLVALAMYTKLQDIIIESTQMFNAYAFYLDHTTYLTDKGGIQQLIVYSLILICFMWLISPKKSMKRIFLYPLCLAVFVSFLQMKVLLLARILWYFDIVTIFALPYLLTHNRLKTPQQKYLLDTIVLVSTFALFLYSLLYNQQRVAFYHFIML